MSLSLLMNLKYSNNGEAKRPPKYNQKIKKQFYWLKKLLYDTQVGEFKNDTFYLGLHYYRCVYDCEACEKYRRAGEEIPDDSRSLLPCENNLFLFPNQMYANGLLFHNIVYHSEEIPEIEWFKLSQLEEYFNMKIKKTTSSSASSAWNTLNTYKK